MYGLLWAGPAEGEGEGFGGMRRGRQVSPLPCSLAQLRALTRETYNCSTVQRRQTEVKHGRAQASIWRDSVGYVQNGEVVNSPFL